MEHSAAQQLTSLLAPQLACVCDVKSVGGQDYFRLNDAKAGWGIRPAEVAKNPRITRAFARAAAVVVFLFGSHLQSHVRISGYCSEMKRPSIQLPLIP